MLAANEARKKTEDVAVERAEKEKKMAEERKLAEEKRLAEEKINAAVSNGEDHCFLGFAVSETTEAWLVSLGYQVQRLYSVKDEVSNAISNVAKKWLTSSGYSVTQPNSVKVGKNTLVKW